MIINSSMIKTIRVAATLISVGLSLTNNWIEDKTMDEKITKMVNLKVTELLKKES